MKMQEIHEYNNRPYIFTYIFVCCSIHDPEWRLRPNVGREKLVSIGYVN